MKRWNLEVGFDHAGMKEDPEGLFVLFDDIAALIAAAPELLKALEDVEGTLVMVTLSAPNADEEGAITAQLRDVRAAIAKARGQA